MAKKGLFTHKRLFAHECRAAGLVFKTQDEWIAWLQANSYNVRKEVAEHDGFKYNINDICINPNVKASYMVDDAWHWEAMTARTQFGWSWGYNITMPKGGSNSPVAYPSRYDISAIFYETEEQALQDALSFIIRQLEGKPKSKNVSMMLFYAKKKRANIVHPQQELFK